MLRQTSLGKLGLIVGGSLTLIGFIAYFTDNATLNLAGFFYGIPLLLGGFALKITELKPVPFDQPTTDAVLALRAQQATGTQTQILNDVTRYRYGLSAHLDSSLSYLGLSPSDEDRPILESIREVSTDGAYTLILEFKSPRIPLSVWQQKQEKMTSFFGPGVRVDVMPAAENRVDVALIATGKAAPEKTTA